MSTFHAYKSRHNCIKLAFVIPEGKSKMHEKQIDRKKMAQVVFTSIRLIMLIYSQHE